MDLGSKGPLCRLVKCSFQAVLYIHIYIKYILDRRRARNEEHNRAYRVVTVALSKLILMPSFACLTIPLLSYCALAKLCTLVIHRKEVEPTRRRFKIASCHQPKLILPDQLQHRRTLSDGKLLCLHRPTRRN